MKKLFLKMCSVLIGILILTTCFINSSYYIENQTWKYSEGSSVGDWFEEGNLTIQDGIIVGSSGKAKIFFCFGFLLVIKNIENGEKGIYINKS